MDDLKLVVGERQLDEERMIVLVEKPLEIVQAEGPSYEVDGNLVRWQRWSMRVTMDPVEGLVIHDVGYEDDGRVRSIIYRAADATESGLAGCAAMTNRSRPLRFAV